MKIYTIKDCKSQTYQGVYTAVNDGIMIRNAQSEFNSHKLGVINDFPEDFSIFCVGEMDELTGVITPHVDFVKNFTDFLEVSKNAR